VVAAVLLVCGRRIWVALAQGAAMRHEATLCSSVVWLGLLLLLLRWYGGAAVLILLTLGVTARHRPPRGSAVFWRVVGYSTLFGGLRLADGLLVSQDVPGSEAAGWFGAGCSMGWLSGGALLVAGLAPVWPLLTRRARAWPRLPASMRSQCPSRWLATGGLGAVMAGLCGGLPLLTVYGLLYLLGRGLAPAVHTSRTAAGALGLSGALLPVALVRPLGETVSLSTLDVRTAFALVAEPWGLPAAVGVVILRHALPSLGLMLGLGPALASAPAAAVGTFAASLAAALTAQALLAAALLAVRGTDPVVGSLALGASVHVACELLYAFGGTALALWLSGRPPKARS
jgi:hypothetical protein